MVAVAEVGRAAGQLSPAAILAMVVGQGAIVHHHRDVREHALRPRHQLLHGHRPPSLGEAVGAPPPQSLEAPLCWDQGDLPAPTAQPFLSCSVGGTRAYLRGLIIGVRIQKDG